MTIYTHEEAKRLFKKRYEKLTHNELVQKINEWEDKVIKLRELLRDRLESLPRC
jgi:hypothetical protein